MDVLGELDKYNVTRSIKGFGMHPSPKPLSFWGNAIAGEVGELCNIIKKIERGDYHKSPENQSDTPGFNDAYAANQYREDIGKEAADVVTYLHLPCSREGIDLGAEVVKKFNEVSERVGCSVRIPT